MIQHEHNGQTFLFVEAPDYAVSFRMIHANARLSWEDGLGRMYRSGTNRMPELPFRCSLLGLASLLTEEQAQSIGCQKLHLDDLGNTWRTYKRGLQTLLESLSLPIERTIVLKKIND